MAQPHERTDRGIARLPTAQSGRAAREEDCAVGDLLAGPPLVLADREVEAQRRATHAQVEALLAGLTPREQQVLRLRYGLDEADGRAHSLNAIAQKLGLDDSTVCMIIRRALQKLRVPQEMEEASPRSPQQQQAQRRQEQLQRLEAACAALETQGVPVSVKTLARLAHVDKEVIRPFVRDYWERQGSEQERLTRACATLEAEGLPVTMASLCSRAHVGGKIAAAFLQNYQPRQPRPKAQRRSVQVQLARLMKAPPHERLARAFARLQAQGEPITRTLLRQEAGVSTDAARTFLCAQRLSNRSIVPLG
jgi:DNA-binding CsgD family transcriptional regulator